MEGKVNIISFFIAISFSIFLLGYFLFQKNNNTYQPGLLTERFSKNLKHSSDKDQSVEIYPISSRKFLSFSFLQNDPDAVVAINKEGGLFQIDSKNFTEKKLLDTGHRNIYQAIFSSSGEKVFYFFYNQDSKSDSVYFDIKNNKEILKNKDIVAAAFDPNGQQIAYIKNTATGKEIWVFKNDIGLRKILETRLNPTEINLNPEFISIVHSNNNGYGGIFTLQDNNRLTKVISDQNNLSANWSPSGKRLIFSSKNTGGSEDLFYKNIGDNNSPIELAVSTSASKCAWINDGYILCGTKNSAYIKDEFYIINLTSGERKMVLSPSFNILTKKLALSQLEDLVFVLNSLDGIIYKFKLIR